MVQALKDALEYAPADAGAIADGLRGWQLPEGYGIVCASCAGRIMKRGCRLPVGSLPVWADAHPEPVTCVVEQ